MSPPYEDDRSISDTDIRIPLTSEQKSLIVEAVCDDPEGMASWARSILLQAARERIGAKEVGARKIDQTNPPDVPLPGPPAPEVSSDFQRLASLWREQTGHMSSAARMAKHPAYQEIVEMGWAVVPSILAELRSNPDHWFLALQQITQEDPVPTQSSGNVMAMAQAWVEWGTKQAICLDAVG